MAGEDYDGGGIRVTTEATRAAGRPALRAGLARRLEEARRAGTTTVEIKSGYGLSVESEVATTSLAAEVTSETTFMGAHVVPTEYLGRADDYVDLVCGPMLESVRPHVRWIDAFCEEGAFDVDQSRAVLEAGRDCRSRSAPPCEPTGLRPRGAVGCGNGLRVRRSLHLPIR